MTSKKWFFRMNPHMALQVAACSILSAAIWHYGDKNATAFVIVVLILQWINWGSDYGRE